ncbi:FecR family protein [Sphingobacterium faecium]|uniref:FecR family protein n=1 Tax=Sphingobacterium faecium TaxID=34087 RepID=UPI002479F82C|nr:FecR domain-containing protein [Sphingobacterium faecium]WGQ12947.1 FecR domain-containing protein [Sphingobacterium faecium]
MDDKQRNELGEKIHNRILDTINRQQRKIHLYHRLTVAATILCLLSISLFIAIGYYKESVRIHKGENLYANFNSGQLILPNGDSIAVSALINANKNLPVQVVRSTDYPQFKSNTFSDDDWITLKTGKGGFFKLLLADGSMVYLNANSEIKYRGDFLKNRIVHVNGEAFFEIKKITNQKQQPQSFTVSGGDHHVTVLGTKFNFENYTDQTIKTTLVEGKVAIGNIKTGITKILRPGEQATADKQGNLQIKDVDIEQYVAWKDGFYYFKDATLIHILDELQQNFEFKFDRKAIPTTTLTFIVKKNRTLSEILNLIEKSSDVKLYLRGSQLMVE